MIVLRAKKSEKGRMPSLTISCLTSRNYQHYNFNCSISFSNHLPPEAVRAMTTMLPKIEAAMIPDNNRGARSPSNTAPKKTVAITNLQLVSTHEIKMDWNLSFEALIDKP